jgi:hypothetical protein
MANVAVPPSSPATVTLTSSPPANVAVARRHAGPHRWTTAGRPSTSTRACSDAASASPPGGKQVHEHVVATRLTGAQAQTDQDRSGISAQRHVTGLRNARRVRRLPGGGRRHRQQAQQDEH